MRPEEPNLLFEQGLSNHAETGGHLLTLKGGA
jgi:hypothetical protein